MQKFENFCIPRQNITLLRCKWLNYKQEEGQRFDKFMAQLKKISSNCEFGQLKNCLIKYIVVIGVIDDSLSERNSKSTRTVRQTNKISGKTNKARGRNLQNKV